MEKYLKYVCLVVFTCTLVNVLNAIDTEFTGVNSTAAKLKGQRYVKQAKDVAAEIGAPLTNLSEDFSGNQTQVKLLGSKWKKEYERLKSLQGNASGFSTPVKSGTPTASQTTGDVRGVKLFPDTPYTPSKADLETMDNQRLKEAAIAMQQQLEALQQASSGSASTSASASASAYDRELNAVFQGDADLIAAYKEAVTKKNFDGFWLAAKHKAIVSLTACINKIQPGNNDSALLNEYSQRGLNYILGRIVKTVNKGEFLRHLEERINALDFSSITLPADTASAITKTCNEYLRLINTEVSRLIDEEVSGNDEVTTVLPNELEPNMRRIEGNIPALRSKHAFKMALSKAILRG